MLSKNTLPNLSIYFQLISANQERFVQMLNEPEESEQQEGGGGALDPEAGGGGPGYIQVTPQEKEAIERVRLLLSLETR